MDLSTLRNEIDRIDSQLVQLYEQRMEICSQVAEYKIENGKKVFDKTREEEKLARVRSLTHNDFNSQGVTELFEQIMAMSRKLQYQMLESHGRTGRLPFIRSKIWIPKRRESYFRAQRAHIPRLR